MPSKFSRTERRRSREARDGEAMARDEPSNDRVVSQEVYPRIARFAPDGRLTYKKERRKKKEKENCRYKCTAHCAISRYYNVIFRM